MVNNHTSQLDRIFYALSDPTRRAMLVRLSKGECSVSALAEPHQQTLAGISKHLKVLESAKLINKTKRGRVITCAANQSAIEMASAALEELGTFWSARLDSLEQFVSKRGEKK